MIQPVPTIRQAVVIGGSQRAYDKPGAPAPLVVSSVTVTPFTFSVIEGLEVQSLVATPRDSGGVAIGGKTATWVSSDTAVATVTSAGGTTATVAAIAVGTATVTATIDGVNGTSTATVLAAAATVSVAPAIFSVQKALTQALSALVLDSNGTQLTGRNINWSSNNAAVATVAAGAGDTAVVTGVSAGTAIITATVESVNGTAAATVTVVSGAHPNEPAGYVRFAEYAFSSVPINSLGASTGDEIDGCAWSLFSGSWSVANDPSTPVSPPNKLSIPFPVGFPSGVGPGFYQSWDTCSETSNTEYSKVYHHLYIQLSGPTWEGHPVLVKWLGFYGVGGNNQGFPPTEMYGAFEGAGLISSFDFFWVVQDTVNRRLNHNRNLNLRVQAGVMHSIEMVMEMNSAVGVGDGIFRMWMDSVLVMEYTDVQFSSVARPSGFYGRRYDPTWGGASVNPKIQNDWIYIDHEYMSGVV